MRKGSELRPKGRALFVPTWFVPGRTREALGSGEPSRRVRARRSMSTPSTEVPKPRDGSGDALENVSLRGGVPQGARQPRLIGARRIDDDDVEASSRKRQRLLAALPLDARTKHGQTALHAAVDIVCL